MDATVVDLLSEQADQVATANPPSKVALTVIAFLFTAVGWIAGRSWWYSAKVIAFAVLAVRYGYRQGARVPVEPVPAPSYPA
jgi:hypothetical protein